jgi:hypothetical protein
MKSGINPLINDSFNADYKITWSNPKSKEKGCCNIFTYGNGINYAIAAFHILYPGFRIDEIVKQDCVFIE